MSEKDWWEQPTRIIQTNLQVKDTKHIKPDKLAGQLKEMGANALVYNVGGIYAWYDSEVSYHFTNPYLPEDTDLLKEVIAACHENNIKFIGRLDFSKAHDYIYLNRPQWFVRDEKGEPKFIGEKRPGKWSGNLLSTCINGGYRNEEVAKPVLREVINNYNIDGIFYNAPGFIPCNCENCQEKYEKIYKEELPTDPEEYREDWSLKCFNDNINNLFNFIKSQKEDLPVILYYGLHEHNLSERLEITDMICTESQNVLSLGQKNIPKLWKPKLNTKLGRSLSEDSPPFGIIHSCPGMDWRHTGLPPAEYLFWLSLVPANGGQIWHSLTGVPDTITDKRILETVTKNNNMIKQVEEYMDGAKSLTQVALLWNRETSAEGWADGLINRQIPFDLILPEKISLETLTDYEVIIIPGNTTLASNLISYLYEFVEKGGNIIIEGNINSKSNQVKDLLGIKGKMFASEELTASYLRFEGNSNPLQKDLNKTELIPLRGKVSYCNTKEGAKTLATLVPPFSPLESVGAPPERASLPVSQTDLPLAILNEDKKGKVIYFPFSLSMLINKYKLNEHYQLLLNTVNMLLGKEKMIDINNIQGLQLAVFKKNENIILNLVNGVGSRPLTENIPLNDIKISLNIEDNKNVKSVRGLISEKNYDFSQKQNSIEISVPELNVWEALLIET